MRYKHINPAQIPTPKPMNKHHIIMLCLIQAVWLSAQPAQKCGHDHWLEQRSMADPEFIERQQEMEAMTTDWLSKAKPRNDTTYTIPVIVHIVWQEGQAVQNLSDEQIRSQIEVLNEDFGLENENQKDIPTAFEDLTADVGFEFCLLDITRTPTRYDEIGNFDKVKNLMGRSRLFDDDLGGKSPVSPDSIINIWVADIGDVLGSGSRPDLERNFVDGLIIDYKVFGKNDSPPYNLGRITTHEMGHFFNLKHIWGDEQRCEVDDDVVDTPKQEKRYFGCPSFPSFSCSSADMFMNFMDYTDDRCAALFTKGQKERMHAALQLFRPGLINAIPCTPPPSDPDSVFSLSVNPNPADNFIIPVITGPRITNAEITVFNMIGQLVYSGQDQSDNIRPIHSLFWPSGIYIVQVKIDGETLNHKVVVTREF